jgi:hypothetical protein
MCKIFTILSFILLLSASTVYSDEYDDFCTANKVPEVPTPAGVERPIFRIGMKYTMYTEANIDTDRQTIETAEYYDGPADIGVAEKNFGAKPIASYAYIPTDELLLVSGNNNNNNKNRFDLFMIHSFLFSI